MIRLLIIFLIIFLGVIYSSDIIQKPYEKRRKHYIIVIVIMLILQSGLRNWYVGADTYQYYTIFEDVKSSSFNDIISRIMNNEGKDQGYYLFQKIFQIFITDYQLYLLFVALIFMSALGHFVYNNTIHIRHVIVAFVLYMAMFYSFFSITGIRQTLATGLLLFGFQFIKKRKLIHFSFFVILASFMHISSLVFFSLYFIANIKRYRTIYISVFILFPIVFLFKNEIATFLVSSSESTQKRFESYLEDKSTNGSIALTAAHILIAYWGMLSIKKTVSMFPSTGIMFSTFAIAFLLFPLQWVNTNAGRVAQYFDIILIVWIPFLIDTATMWKSKQREVLYLLIIGIFIFLTLFSIRKEAEYKFFWQYMEIPYNYR
ncbi:EpsG family protein [Chryseobacterium sp. CFS15]|uniref:EpsG family protein n=1 Tax=Chryseobacterium sp. CFS15 TaxID=2986946 RepID=UPI0028096148|nr:EpsG family protein [Chryseobacterium sp. CFS15]MDQ8144322.1 EpsG family protein [Chryseobacterium sp. CFS15]